MTTEQRQSRASQSSASGVGRATFGTVLFIAWGVLSVLWVYDAIYELAQGYPTPAITAVAAVLLMLVLAVMEGLEVVMIHDWSRLYPDRTAHDLADWLAARQMFVASICVAATILAARAVIHIPFTSYTIEGSNSKIFNLVWTTFTILWFMQILPKVMAALNPDRYLKMVGRYTLPVVNVVKAIGVSWPAEKTAAAVQSLTGWHPEPTLERARRGPDLAEAWAALIPEDGRAAQRRLEQ